MSSSGFTTALRVLKETTDFDLEAHTEKQSKLMSELIANKTDGKILPKKKTRQLKLKEAFTQRNFQKYPLDKCVYNFDLRKHVYEPPMYKKHVSEVEQVMNPCCSSCYLQPCIMIGKKVDFMESLKADHEDPDFAIANAKILAVILFNRCCGQLWSRRMKIQAGPPSVLPACVGRALPRYLRVVSSIEDDYLYKKHESEISEDDTEEETDSDTDDDSIPPPSGLNLRR